MDAKIVVVDNVDVNYCFTIQADHINVAHPRWLQKRIKKCLLVS